MAKPSMNTLEPSQILLCTAKIMTKWPDGAHDDNLDEDKVFLIVIEPS